MNSMNCCARFGGSRGVAGGMACAHSKRRVAVDSNSRTITFRMGGNDRVVCFSGFFSFSVPTSVP